MRKQRGITLIALVLTIIILLILAGVAIATLTGDNGLLTKAGETKNTTIEAEGLEKIKLAVAAAQLAGQGTITTKNLKSELKSNFNDNVEVFENLDYWYYKKYRIYKDGNVREGNLLPDEFQQLEYIESTGKQYIDTNQKLPFSINILAKLTTTNEMEALLGCQNGKSPYNATFIRTGIWGNFVFLGDDLVQNSNFDNNIHRYIVHYYKNNACIKIDNLQYENISTNKDYLQYTVYLFALNSGGTAVDYSNHFQIYECKIYSDSENTNLIRNFIPCKSTTTVTNADGKSVPSDTKGLYDLVEGKFYTNANTAADAVDFIAGPDV